MQKNKEKIIKTLVMLDKESMTLAEYEVFVKDLVCLAWSGGAIEQISNFVKSAEAKNV